MKAIDLTGQRFGRLVAVSRAPSRNTLSVWNCVCDCGEEREVFANNLRRNHTTSCGCFRDEQIEAGLNGRHGMSDSRPHRIWQQMRARCRNANYSEYHLYGGRGIRVCPEWESYEVFWADMGPTYADNLSIDRIDNDKGYSKENCRWQTAQQQARNTRLTIFIETEWGRIPLCEAAERAGLPYSTVYGRHYKLGWSENQLLEPKRR